MSAKTRPYWVTLRAAVAHRLCIHASDEEEAGRIAAETIKITNPKVTAVKLDSIQDSPQEGAAT